MLPVHSFKQIWICLVLVTTLCSAIVRSTRAADWPQWLGPNRNGVTSEIVAPWDEAHAPAVVWRREIARGYSAPVIAEGTVFLHSTVTGNDEEQVLALDAETGNPLWTDVYSRETYRSALGVGPRTTPTVSDGRLYTYGITGELSAYEIKSGKRLWQTNPYKTLEGTMPRFGVCSSPVVVQGRVIVMVGGGGSAVAAYDASSGELAWKVFDEPASSASPIVLTRGEGDGQQADVVVQTTLRVMGLSPQDGTLRWEHPLVFQPTGVSPTPLVVDQSLICTTQDTGTLALDFSSPRSTQPKSPWWKQNATSYFSTGVTGPSGTVLVVTNLLDPLPRADVTCLDLVQGETLWKQEKLGYFHVGLITTGDGKLLLLDDSGNLILAEVTRTGFKQLSKSQVCRGTLSNPALANGRVYVRDDKEVICLQFNLAG